MILPNSFPMDKIFEIFSYYPELILEHDFLNDNEQIICVKGVFSAANLALLAYEHIEGLQELGISRPNWPSNAFGVIVFIVTYMVFEEAEHAR